MKYVILEGRWQAKLISSQILCLSLIIFIQLGDVFSL